MNDAERKHRWLTQAELDAMLDKAREEGPKATDEKLRALLVEAWNYMDHGDELSMDEFMSLFNRIGAALEYKP